MKGEYYIEQFGNDWGVFNTDDIGAFISGHCYALYSDKKEAENKAKEFNEEQKRKGIL